MKIEKSIPQMNIELKKKICEIFLIYVKNKMDFHIERIIKHIRENNQAMQFLGEQKIYESMKDPKNIKEILPMIQLPIPIYDHKGKNEKLRKKREMNSDVEYAYAKSESFYPPLNSLFKFHTPAYE